MALVIAISNTYIYAQEEEPTEPKPTNEAVRKHCEKFINCIISDKPEQALTYMAAEYVRDQHNIFLGGAISQFLREFLAGNSLIGDDFIVPDNISDIDSMKITEIRIDPDEFEFRANIIFEIKLTTGERYSVDVYMSIDERGRLGFLGAAG